MGRTEGASRERGSVGEREEGRKDLEQDRQEGWEVRGGRGGRARERERWDECVPGSTALMSSRLSRRRDASE